MYSNISIEDNQSNQEQCAEKGKRKKELTRELVGELIKEIAVTDPENIEIRWNFLDEIIKFVTGEGMVERGVC